MKIRDNETGEVFEYGTNRHHALRISRNGGCLTFENLQNGDGSLKSGDGGYSFVLDDGKTPEESVSPDAVNGSTYANIGGFYEENSKNDGWIPVEERLPEEKVNPVSRDFYEYQVTANFGFGTDVRSYKFGNGHWWSGPGIVDQYVIAWRPLPEPYRPDHKAEKPDWRQNMLRKFDGRSRQ